jgi:hypothetical protein
VVFFVLSTQSCDLPKAIFFCNIHFFECHILIYPSRIIFSLYVAPTSIKLCCLQCGHSLCMILNCYSSLARQGMWEFMRNGESHTLPKGFVKIRHYGCVRNNDRSSRLKQLFSHMQLPSPPPKLTVPVATLMMEKHGVDLTLCPKCKPNKMETVTTYRRGILCAIVSTKADYQPSIAAKNKDSPNP